MYIFKKNKNIFIYKSKISDLIKISKIIVNYANNSKIYFLNGEISSGKTTLVKYICYFLGVKSIIKSPTFSLVNEYKCNSLNNVYHFDFYRIKNQNDLINIDINYYLYSNSYCFIEWPLKMNSFSLKKYTYINITFNNNFSRNFYIYNVMK